MLRFLRIRNLAVIEAVDVEFESGFNVLTGETGAGKSILVEAVSLLLGGRASADLVRTGESQATIEAVFERSDGTEAIVRREISNQGRSRSFLDGAIVTAAELKSVGLVEIHGQNEHQALLDPLTHLPFLDTYAESGRAVADVGMAWADLRAAREQLDASLMDGRERAARLDLITFQLGEIAAVSPLEGEDDELVTLRQVLVNAERVQRLCEEGYNALYDGEHAVLASLSAVWKRVGELSSIDGRFAPYLEARAGIKSQLEDLSSDLRQYGQGIDASPERLREVEERLVSLERIKRKYGPTLADVRARGAALAEEQQRLDGSATSVRDLTATLDRMTEVYLARARALSSLRQKAAVRFSKDVERLLADLAMARTRFEVRFVSLEMTPSGWGERGLDQAEFFVSPNPGEEVRPLARIASGGELSRAMLAIKTLAARAGGGGAGHAGRYGRTLIFDEVDAGIGGRVADVVGCRLQDLGDDFQVLCITHLPQIAARAGAQFRIDKTTRGGRTMTSVTPLDDEGRVEEISRMMAGAAVTEPVRAGARELLAQGPTQAKGKHKAKGESGIRRVR